MREERTRLSYFPIFHFLYQLKTQEKKEKRFTCIGIFAKEANSLVSMWTLIQG